MLADDGTPYIYWNDVWSPICGHGFWNNDYGATLFCQKLGYDSGTKTPVKGKFTSMDALDLDVCGQNDHWLGCAGGYSLSARCSAGNPISITIACQGNSAETSSCKSKPNQG